MDERKKFFLTIIVGLAGLFFLITRFFLPIAKDNTQRSAQYKQLKTEVETMEEFSKDELDSLQDRIDTAISNLERRIPAEGKLKLMEQLTRVPMDSNIVFTEIAQREPQEREEYQVFPVDVNMKAPFYDLIRYLAGIEASPLMIGIDSLSLRKVEPAADSLDIKITFSGFRITGDFAPISKYLEERYRPLNKQRLERLFEPVKAMDSESAVSRLKDYDPFVSVYDFEKPVVGKIVRPEPETIKIEIEGLSLKGIMRIGDEKVALINDTVVREGEEIAGMQVAEIQDYRVVLVHSGKRYILKIEGVDEFIKP